MNKTPASPLIEPLPPRRFFSFWVSKGYWSHHRRWLAIGGIAGIITLSLLIATVTLWQKGECGPQSVISMQ